MLLVQLAEAFLLAEAVELGGDDGGGGLVGGASELGVEPQGRRALSVAEASGDGVQVGARGQELGSGVVPELLSELVMPNIRLWRSGCSCEARARRCLGSGRSSGQRALWSRQSVFPARGAIRAYAGWLATRCG